ncbi:DLA class I histocompatibility antigen, A9/A9 alpha chain isoform X2 [Esox lucius]|uniref:Ig-like domain-containing protein n=1 Tax=Esox lucius TaxID=8010 RepID=A0AAY5KZK4_ESOLU|nr:DLA class I histocompatibility antigen, A9/A9 alpha chain isoform X2 [Esox lucius]
MRELRFFFLLLSTYSIVNAGSGSHSLWAFATCISGETPFAECSVVLMMDDIQVGYFDSNTERFVHKGHNTQNATDVDMAKDATYVFGHMFLSLKRRLSALKYRYNSTDAFNGIYADLIHYNITHYSYNSGNLLSPWSQVHQTNAKWRYQTIYLPICIKTLKKFLEKEKNFVMRKVRPRVRLIQKAVSGGTRVSCLAFGFYPRHINLTLQRDGQTIPDQELSAGLVLPSADGTYQLRKSLTVSAEELSEKHSYTCSTFHLSLDNKLDVSWVPRDGTDPVLVSIPSAALLIACLAILLACVWRRRNAAGTHVPHPSNADEAQAVEQISLSSHDS